MTRDPRLLGALAALVAAIGVGGWFVAHEGWSPRPVSFTDRFDHLRHDDAGGRMIEGDLKLHMRTGGQLTYFTVFHDRARRRSDELALYEQVGDRPRVAMRFEPLADHGAPWLFTHEGGGSVDLNGNGQHEVVGFFARPGVPDGRVPVIVFWDASTLRYRVAALIHHRAARLGWHLDRVQRRRYGRPQSLVPVGRGAVARGYTVGAAQVISGGGRTRLVAALYARPPRAGLGSARLATWELGSIEGEPDRSRRCAVPPGLVRIEVLGFDVAARTELQRTGRRLPGTCVGDTRGRQ